jgi:hypothetical protein
MGRIQKLLVAVGRKGVGKTFTTNQLIDYYVKGNPAKNVPGRRVLIIDVNGEFEHIKSINKKHILAFSAHPVIEARRILPFNDDGSKMTLDQVTETLFEVLQNYKNGLLVIEDVNKYVGDHMPNDLIGAICTNRHANLDIILHYQSIGRIQTKVWQNLNALRFHKISDSVSQHIKKFAESSECFLLAEYIVNYVYKKNPRYYLWVDFEELKIQGNINDELRTFAIKSYLSDNYRKVVKPKIGRIDVDNPKLKITEENVIQLETKRLLETYF